MSISMAAADCMASHQTKDQTVLENYEYTYADENDVMLNLSVVYFKYSRIQDQFTNDIPAICSLQILTPASVYGSTCSLTPSTLTS